MLADARSQREQSALAPLQKQAHFFQKVDNTVLLLAVIRKKLILRKNKFSLWAAPTIICVAIMPQCISHCVEGHMERDISGPDSITSYWKLPAECISPHHSDTGFIQFQVHIL